MEFSSTVGVWIALFPGSALIVNEGSYPGWRSLCWLLGGLYVLSGALIFILYHPVPPPNPENLTKRQRLAKIDFVGTLLFALAFTPFIVGLVFGGNAYPWRSAATLVPLIGGILMMGVLAAHQTFVQKDGIFAHAMFRNHNYPIALYGCLVEGMVYLVYNAYYGVETAALFETRPYQLAARFAGFTWGIVFSIPFYAIYVYRTKRIKGVLIVGYTLMLGGGIGDMVITRTKSALPIGMIVLSGMGFASPQIFLTTIVQLAVPPQYVGLASSLTQSARFVGGSVGIAASGAILTSKLDSKLPTYIARAASEAGLPAASVPSFVAAIAKGDATTAMKVQGVTASVLQAGANAAKDAYADSFRFVWAFTIPFIVIGLVGCIFLKSVRHEMDGRFDRPTEKIAADLAHLEETKVP